MIYTFVKSNIAYRHNLYLILQMENRFSLTPHEEQEEGFFSAKRNFYEQPPNDDEHIFRLPAIPVDMRLKENRERKMMIEEEKKREKEEILRRRKEKEDNVERILREKEESRENAKMTFEPNLNTCGNGFSTEIKWKKAEQIENKIVESRNRAQMYKTMYQKKIHESNEEKERNVKVRKDKKEKKEIERSMNYHLAEWNRYEKKIISKYKGEKINQKRLYENHERKQLQIKKLVAKNKTSVSQSQAQINSRPSGERNSLKRDKNIKSNPINLQGEISTFGLQKSIKNPEKVLKDILGFIDDRVGLEDPSQDQELLTQLQLFLAKDIDL